MKHSTFEGNCFPPYKSHLRHPMVVQPARADDLHRLSSLSLAMFRVRASLVASGQRYAPVPPLPPPAFLSNPHRPVWCKPLKTNHQTLSAFVLESKCYARRNYGSPFPVRKFFRHRRCCSFSQSQNPAQQTSSLCLQSV